SIRLWLECFALVCLLWLRQETLADRPTRIRNKAQPKTMRPLALNRASLMLNLIIRNNSSFTPHWRSSKKIRNAAGEFRIRPGSTSNPYERLDLVFIDDEMFRKAGNFRSLLGHHYVPSVQGRAQSFRSHSAFCHSTKR